MPIVKLKQAQIDAGMEVPSGRKRIEFCCADTPGLLVEFRATSPSVGTWYLRFKAQGKTAYERLGNTRDTLLVDAREKARNFKAQLQLGVARKTRRGSSCGPTLSEFWADSYEPYIRPRLRSYAKLKQIFVMRVEPRFGHVPLVDLKRQELQAFHAELAASGLAPATADHVLKVVRQCLNYAVSVEALIKNPIGKFSMLNVDNRRMDDFMSAEELNRFLTVMRTHRNRQVCHLALWLLATGARLREALRARWPDINRETRIWLVPPEHSKSKLYRPIVLNDAAVEILDCLGTEKLGGPLFINERTGKPLKWVHKSFERLMVLAGLPKITPHSLRRNFVLHALDSGASIYAVSKLLGHASVETTTKRYASMSNPALFEAANGASKFLQGRLPVGTGQLSAAA
jgi:integrase